MGKFIQSIIISAVFLLASYQLLPGAEEETASYQLGNIIVTPTKTKTYTEETGSSIRVITSEDLKGKGNCSVFDALKDTEGVIVTQAGIMGGPVSIYIRGTKPGDTLVLLDGVEINDPSSIDRGYYNLADITTDDIEQIEIVRGPQSTLYGSDAIGGVINIITKKGSGSPKIDASFEAGSYKTFKESTGISGANNKVNYAFNITRIDSSGISAAKGGAEDDGYKNTTLSSRAGLSLSDNANLNLILRYTDARSDLDDAGWDDDPNYTGKGKTFISKIEFNQVIKPWWNHKLSLSYLHIKRDYNDGIDNVGNYTDIFKMHSWYKGDNKKIEWQNNFPITAADTITAGMEYEREGASSLYKLGTYESRTDRRTVSNKALYFQNQLKLWDSLFTTIGGRADRHEEFGTKGTYRISALYLLKKIDANIKANWGTGIKAPSLFQLYSSFGNTSLNPEKSKGWDIGLEKKIFNDKLSMAATWFHNNIKDIIDWNWGTSKYENIDEAETKGIEAKIALKIIKALDITLGYTYTEAKDKQTHLVLLRRPKNQFNLGINWHFLKKGILNLNIAYIDRRKDINAGVYPSTRIDLSPYARVDLACSYKITKNTQLYARIENLLDKDYQDVYGYSTPGISAYSGIKVKI